MVINHFRKNDTLTVAPEGRLDSTTSDDFATFIDMNFTDDVRRLVIDFSGVDFISSKGLRVMVSIYKGLKGRKLEIVGANASVTEVFRISGLLKIFQLQ